MSDTPVIQIDWDKRHRGGLNLDGERFGPSRNAPCYCGSGRKLKKCHGATAPRTARVTDPRFVGKLATRNSQ